MEPKISSLHVDPSKIEASDFDCVLCCRTLYRPVVTPCGHTYCWVSFKFHFLNKIASHNFFKHTQPNHT